MPAEPTGSTATGLEPRVSVIVPARNEEVCLAECLASLNSQQGVNFEIIVVDDGSSDGTRAIAESFAGVRVANADALPPGWSGKSNAMVTGANLARGHWLLFTDADTVHQAGSLARAVAEAERAKAELLSYSPRQVVQGLAEKCVMPVIFAELAATYRPALVSDPKSPAAAANGQYLMISREAYEAVGGFAAVAGSLLDDVAMARAVKASGRKILFRYAPDAVRTRMYRSFWQLREGWTKNLMLLFPATLQLAALRFIEFALIAGCVALAILERSHGRTHTVTIAAAVAAILYVMFVLRIRRAHFAWDANLLALFGLPLFSYLLIRSRAFHDGGVVTWKGRTYGGPNNPQPPGAHPMNAAENTTAPL